MAFSGQANGAAILLPFLQLLLLHLLLPLFSYPPLLLLLSFLHPPLPPPSPLILLFFLFCFFMLCRCIMYSLYNKPTRHVLCAGAVDRLKTDT